MKQFDLTTSLIELSGEASEASHWTIGNAVEGVQIFGGIGSGKSSGSGRMIALKYLQAGFGGLVLTVKPDEKETWEEYCELTGRSGDLIIVEPGRKNLFNFIDYESQDGGLTENIVQVLKTVIRASEDKESGGADSQFWEMALDMLIFNVIDLCKLAYGDLSLQRIFDIVQTLPTPETAQLEKPTAFKIAFAAASHKVSQAIETWENKMSIEAVAALRENGTYDEALKNKIPEARIMDAIDNFFWGTFLNLNDKTRSIIEFSFSGFLFRLLRDPIYSLFCRYKCTYTPDDCLQGKIILLNLPVKTHHKIGRDCQIMFKYIWQRAMEKRNVKENNRPVFLWADEAQNFLHEHDADYQATARSSKIATVYISQNLPNYHANMGGSKSEYRVKAFLGTLNTKIFHANADIETNRYASELIGDGSYEETSRTVSAAGEFSSSNTRSHKIDRLIRPEAFIRLKTGGDLNNGTVEGYLHLQGNPIKDGFNHIKIQFNQNYMSDP
ncbi:MAG: TraM recognition domain-containing protein [Flavobacterium sp.]|nr:TraM recognition domain-containing protein [Flavobacterium sp.]